MIQFAGLTTADLMARARQVLPVGHGVARAVHGRMVRDGHYDPAGHGLNAVTEAGWRQHFALDLPQPGEVVGEDGDRGMTAKASLRLSDGLECESVLLPMGRGRATLCISSQVGCKMGCRFCETGRMGLLRNMSAAEIVGQVLVARHRLGWRFNNLVFMGMGEALDNADAVIQAIRVLTDPAGLCFGHERVTLCTVGHVDGLARLKAAGLPRMNVSVSLNAANDPLRSELMPVNRRTPLAELQRALIAYRPRRNFAWGINYCLMPGINDSRSDAADIARFCEPLGRVLLNLIPYNPGSLAFTRAPAEADVVRFVEWLREEGLPVRRRITKGRSVMAACGQLGNLALRRAHRDRQATSARRP